QDALMVRAAYLAMDLTAWFVIVPLSFASLLTALVMSLGTPWGLFRHYWILAKFLINTFAIVLLLVHTRLISFVASAAAESTLSAADLRGLRIRLVAVAGAALLALLTATTLAIYKPRGMTAYGRRKQRHRRETPRAAPARQMRADPTNGATGAGRRSGVKVVVAAIGVIVLVAVVLHLVGGGHGNHSH
ncbi:MAG TPA: hypothetical protein PK867_13180, partial [Pirellulales bacterium]|nr:hypothetical protein [Pirellulales bacterium]